MDRCRMNYNLFIYCIDSKLRNVFKHSSWNRLEFKNRFLAYWRGVFACVVSFFFFFLLVFISFPHTDVFQKMSCLWENCWYNDYLHRKQDLVMLNYRLSNMYTGVNPERTNVVCPFIKNGGGVLLIILSNFHQLSVFPCFSAVEAKTETCNGCEV